VRVQEPLAAMDPPDKLMLVVPDIAVGVPLHVFVRFGLDETARPAGRVSLKATP